MARPHCLEPGTTDVNLDRSYSPTLPVLCVARLRQLEPEGAHPLPPAYRQWQSAHFTALLTRDLLCLLLAVTAIVTPAAAATQAAIAEVAKLNFGFRRLGLGLGLVTLALLLVGVSAMLQTRGEAARRLARRGPTRAARAARASVRGRPVGAMRRCQRRLRAPGKKNALFVILYVV